MNPEFIPELFSILLDAGALDVFATPVLMKKGRPGFALKTLCTPDMADALTELLLIHSSTLGVRRMARSRRVLERAHQEVQTPWGPCRVKLGLYEGQVLNRAPEFEDCKDLAQRAGVPMKTVYAWAMAESLKDEH
jgi:uncharacterized protein (DUF111 family)